MGIPPRSSLLALLSTVAWALEPIGPLPMTTYVQCNLIEVGDVDAKTQAFYADFYLTLFWRDDSATVVDGTFDPSTTFVPYVEFTNRLMKEAINMEWSYMEGFYGVPTALIPPEAYVNDSAVWLAAYTRVAGTFTADLDMHGACES